MKDTKSLAWLLPAAGLLILVGWFLGRQGWSISKFTPPGIELVPPTATVALQSIQPSQPANAPFQPSVTPTVSLAVDVNFVVQANQPWQDTGIQLEKGAQFIITYVSGEWTGKSGSGGMSGPDYGPSTANSDPCFPIQGEGSSLIGKIDSGLPFKVGYQYIGEAQETGFLYLRMNDCDSWLFDNKGSITVNIQVRR